MVVFGRIVNTSYLTVFLIRVMFLEEKGFNLGARTYFWRF